MYSELWQPPNLFRDLLQPRLLFYHSRADYYSAHQNDGALNHETRRDYATCRATNPSCNSNWVGAADSANSSGISNGTDASVPPV